MNSRARESSQDSDTINAYQLLNIIYMILSLLHYGKQWIS